MNAAQDGDEAAQDVVNFANALRVVNIATKVFAVVSILSVLVDFFLAVFHKMTYTFSMWNETDVDLEWSLTYTADDTSWLNSDGKSGGNWYPFPKMNNVESGLIPLGGGLDYDKVAAVNLSLANGSKSAAISAVGIHVCIAIRQKGATENVMVVLIDAPLIGDNKMLLDQGKGDESYYNDNIDRATESLSTSFKFQVAGKTLEAKLSTDQNSGETHYGGIGGYNYNALLYIKNAGS
ncbi:MAG: hypothetical protein IPM89_15360 [Candidatus Competibacteraceae bacterium]|nr:MAG: hypothetical protein IPM89_15360 [Candidatus Competibacteraceae bacterium]